MKQGNINVNMHSNPLMNGQVQTPLGQPLIGPMEMQMEVYDNQK